MSTPVKKLADGSQPGEDALVALARRGDEPAIRAIVKAHNQRLYRVARGVLKDDAEAEDVVQETYLKAFRNLATFHGDSRLSTWLTRIAVHEALGRLRQKRPTLGSEALEAIGDDHRVLQFPALRGPSSPEANFARAEVRDIVQAAVDALPAAFRMIFILRDIEELSVEETAEHLGIRAETVKTRLFRARRLLRQALTRKLKAGLADVFPFDGWRCDRLADRVVARLATASARPASA